MAELEALGDSIISAIDFMAEAGLPPAPKPAPYIYAELDLWIHRHLLEIHIQHFAQIIETANRVDAQINAAA
jgi:hypothetical protein